MTTSPWLTPAEACAYLKLKAKYRIQTINTWARQKRVKALKVGHEWRFRAEWLDQLKPV